MRCAMRTISAFMPVIFSQLDDYCWPAVFGVSSFSVHFVVYRVTLSSEFIDVEENYSSIAIFFFLILWHGIFG